jgi:NAD(P)-dependent dehydrogenase (short-subunit alcohol dehydrogenase family)
VLPSGTSGASQLSGMTWAGGDQSTSSPTTARWRTRSHHHRSQQRRHYHATKYAVEALSDALRFEVGGFGVDVIVVEPRAIRTELGATAIARVDAVGGSADYAVFRDALKHNIRDAYDGRLAALADGPEAVAKAITRALAARRPRTRYVVTAGVRLMIGPRRRLPDRAFDALLRTQFPVPGR